MCSKPIGSDPPTSGDAVVLRNARQTQSLDSSVTPAGLIFVVHPGVFVLDDRLRREHIGLCAHSIEALHGGADGHELDQAAHFVNVGFDADHVVGADGRGFVGDQADGVLAGVVNQRGQIVNLAFAERLEHRLQPANDAERIHGRAQHQLERA